MSGIIQEAIEDAERVAEAVVADVEHVFMPRPGGKIDTARRNAEAGTLADEPVARQDYLVKGRPVAVDSLMPDVGTTRTVTLDASNPALPVLPRDTTRRSAVLLAIDNDVYLSNDPGAVMNAVATNGATAQGCGYLPKGVPLPIGNTDQLWAGVTTTGSESRVSVISSFAGTR